MKAIFKTKSNYKKCNGVHLEVVDLLGTIIACKVPELGFDEFGNPLSETYVIADFAVKELVNISNK